MTVVSSAQRKKRKMTSKIKLQRVGNHDEFINRITKTLYYGKIPLADRFSLPVSELAAELFSEVKNGCSLDRLHVDEAAEISRNACVSPCSLVLALLYLERLKTCNSEYVEKVAPSELFLVSMMVASKFLHDDGEEDEVFNDEWATSGGIEVKDMNRLEREFLNAINWEVFVSEQAFWERLSALEGTLALRQGKLRGWFSYTELSQLVNAIELVSLAHTFITVSAVCLTSYTAGVLVMVGSTIAVNQVSSLTSRLNPLSAPAVPFTSCPLQPPCLSNQTLNDSTSWQSFLNVLDDTNNSDSHGFQREKDQFDNINRLITVANLLPVDRENWLSISDFVPVEKGWSETKNWLESVSELVRVASTTTYPTMIAPVEILTY